MQATVGQNQDKIKIKRTWTGLKERLLILFFLAGIQTDPMT